MSQRMRPPQQTRGDADTSKDSKDSKDSLAQSSRGLVLSEAIINTQQNLGLTQKELAEIIHTSESTISRWKHGSELDPASAEGHNALLFIRIYRSLDTLIGGDDAEARVWLRSYNEHLHEKPIELLKTLEGLMRVLNYLDAMRGLA